MMGMTLLSGNNVEAIRFLLAQITSIKLNNKFIIWTTQKQCLASTKGIISTKIKDDFLQIFI